MTPPDDLLAVRAPLVTFHVLKDADGLYLIDSGFVSGPRLLRRALKRRGWDHLPVRGIILTHGHLDHALNAVPFAEKYGAWIAGPRLDADFCRGKAAYTGITRVCGWLEAAGRWAFRYRPFTPDRLLDPGDVLPVWGGLRAVHLPGHTPGHTGYLSESRKLMFTGDLFNSHPLFISRPPHFLNWSPEQIPVSIATAAGMDLAGVIPAHGDDASPEVHLARLHKLSARLAP